MNFRIPLNKQFLSIVCTLNYNISQIQHDWIRFVRMMSINILTFDRDRADCALLANARNVAIECEVKKIFLGLFIKDCFLFFLHVKQ